MSMTASGKLADTVVYFSWKGISVVRQWLIPANPQSADQGDIRLVIGGLGRAAGKCEPDSAFHDQLKALDLIPAQQTKQSYLVQYIKDTFLSGVGATLTANYATYLAAVTGATISADWGTGADTLELTEFDLDYASIAPFDKRLGLYLLAKAAIALEFTGAPYSIDITAWTGAQVDQLVAHLQA